MSEDTRKHFNLGNVYGNVKEVKEDESAGKKMYLQITVDVSGTHSGLMTAYCRMWDERRCREFLDHYKANGGLNHWFRGFFGQYEKDGNFLSNFTVYKWDIKEAPARAAFILKGEVSHTPSRTTDGGQRFLLNVAREGMDGRVTEEKFELWSQGEKLLPEVALGNLVEVKGLVRQEQPDDFFGGSSGPIRSYVHELRKL